MLSNNIDYIQSFAAPVRKINVMAYLKEKATNTTVALWNKEAIKNITYERIGDNTKFYGFGVCQKINIHIIDKDRALEPTTAHYIQLYMGTNETAAKISPKLYITEVRRDELTNELSITAYDAIYQMPQHTVKELDTVPPMNIAFYITEGLAAMGLSGYKVIGDTEPFKITYQEGANLEGTETLRAMYDAIAEATQSIYYFNTNDTLVFRQLDKDGEAAYTIDKEQYYALDSGDNRRLAAICHTTELGDSITAALTVSGTTQYIRDNPFYELRTDIDTLLNNALELMGGLTINQLDCEWRGNPLVEIGDKVAFITKDNKTAFSYLLDDVIEYNGTLKQRTQWHYEDNAAETAENPVNLGKALYNTYAKVDKVNRQIDIVASEAEANKNNIAAIQMNTNSIAASVSRIEENTTVSLNGVNSEIATLTNKVETALTADSVKLLIQEELTNGVDKVYTSTGFAFDADGLRVSKTGSEMETLLDEDGLSVFRDNTEVLTADNTGVNGINMTVRQYLIVGGSRFEAYGSGRTGCFWLG